MKNTLRIAILVLLLSPSILYSQSVTFDITGGYCFPAAPDMRNINSTVYENQTFPYFYTTAASVKPVSFGKGGHLAFGFNWYSKKNIGFGLKLNGLFSSPFAYSTTVVYLQGVAVDYKLTDKAFSFQFIPHICYKHDFKVVSPMIETGMIIGITAIRQSYRGAYGSTEVYSAARDYGGAMVGFYTSAGLAFNVSKVVKIMLAVNCSVGSYSPKKWEQTQYTVNGVDQLNSLPPSDRSGNYVAEKDLQAPQNNNQPGKQIKYSAAFSNVGITTGLCFMITKKKRNPTLKDDSNMVQPF
jgi:hypothetical protein